MKVSIGVLAYNEESAIASTIRQIFQQDIFNLLDFELQLVVVANGCSDNTAIVAEQEIQKRTIKNSFSYKVVDLQQAGKSNAWNVYVHEESWQDADYLILIDADIELNGNACFTTLIQQLMDTPEAIVSIDIPKKDIERKHKKNLVEKFSILLSNVDSKKRTSITGQLYCILGEAVREIYFPKGLPVEDGFLAAMIETDNFTKPRGITKITVAESVSHYFQALVSPIELLKHEKRLMIGSTINSMIYSYLWKHASNNDGHAGALIRELNISDPNWLISLIKLNQKEKGFWIVPKILCLKHLRNWHKNTTPLLRKLFKLPVILVATLSLTCLALNVNIYFKTKTGIGHW